MDRLTFRHALARCMGLPLTPQLCAAIEVEASREPDRSIDLAQFAPLVHGQYVIHIERFAAVLPELEPLHAAHWRETERHRHGLAMTPNYDAMAADDRAGRLLQFTVRHRARLVGNLRMYVVLSRHTCTPLAQEDTLYLSPEHRGSFLVMKLMRYAEDALVRLGVREIEANSKLVNGADVLMRRLGYTPVAIQFHKFIGEPTQ